MPLLQPSLHPWPPWAKRLAVLLALGLAVAVTGLLAPARTRPPELLLSAGRPAAYVRAVERRIAQARSRVWVAVYVARFDPASEPGDPVRALFDALAGAARRGVDVRVVLDLGKVFDSDEIDPKHEAAAAWLRANGVTAVVDDLAVTTHAKAVVIDSRWVVMGSHNWTRAALLANREASVVLDDPALSGQLERELFGRVPGW